MLNQSTLIYLQELKENNDRKWFSENRERYDITRQNFRDYFDDFAWNMVKLDSNLKDSIAESHMFRINRDVRFSKNKLPYKAHFSGYISAWWKSNIEIRACYYLHIEPGNNFLWWWVYDPTKQYLEKIREVIAERWHELEAIIEEKNFKKYFWKLREHNMLKTAPRWYAKDHRYIHLLRYKWFSVRSMLTDSEVLSTTSQELYVKRAKALKPLCDWLNGIHI